jgi:DNA-binding transcriptional LysR family regulator
MDSLAAISLSQIDAFLAVVDAGSFSAAARRLNRTQPAVTYAIDKLEDLVGFPVFDRSFYRPVLTVGGQALLPQARQVAHDLARMSERARMLRADVEPEVRLVVDGQFPMPLLLPVVGRFRDAWPGLPLRIMVENLSASVAAVRNGSHGIGLLASLMANHPDFERTAVLDIDLILVAAPDHPLAAGADRIEWDDLRRHVQIVLTDRAEQAESREFGVIAAETWRTSDLGAKHAMVRAGLGWGSLPAHLVEPEIAAGRLVPLNMADTGLARRRLVYDLVWKAGVELGPATRWLASQLSSLAPA